MKYIKAASIICMVLKTPGVQQKHIAKITGWNNSTVSRICSQLVKSEFLAKDVTKGTKYYPGKIFTDLVKIKIET